jgi:hypothetical protein
MSLERVERQAVKDRARADADRQKNVGFGVLARMDTECVGTNMR